MVVLPRVISSCLIAWIAPSSLAWATPPTSSGAIGALRAYLAAPAATRGSLAAQPFATVPLSRAEADLARRMLWADHDHVLHDRASGAAELNSRVLHDRGVAMRFSYEVYGAAPDTGHSLFISLHGGGQVPAAINDQQWRIQQHLFEPAEGIYLAPRAPTDASDMWSKDHVDRFLDRLIEDMIIVEGVDPNRVYLMGNSAGGDGVYQLAPRMADRWAAAAMMAGHPNDASPLGLRNLPFAGHVGELDSAFGRNQALKQWGAQLDDLERADPGSYVHLIKLHPGKANWMDGEEAETLPWLANFTRDPFPKRTVWKQDDVTHDRMYWLAIDRAHQKPGSEVIAERDGQIVKIQTFGVSLVTIRLNDRMFDLDQPIVVLVAGNRAAMTPARSIATLAKTLAERGDPTSMYCAELTLFAPSTK